MVESMSSQQYLKQVLNELFSYCCEDILSTIDYVVRGGNINSQIEKFLTVLKTAKQLEAWLTFGLVSTRKI